MKFEPFLVEDLAHASYFIACDKTKNAAVIDPQRDVSEYLETAKSGGYSITHVFETHLHADFISGHMELAQKTGAKIYIAKLAQAGFAHQAVVDGEEIEVGSLRVKVLETPGHTPEGVCYLVTDASESKTPKMIFTGDTLFVGSVGRPDLFGEEKTRELAGQLFDSLQNKLFKLPDEVEVYPGHGAGSFCGAGMASEPSSTIGQEKKFNSAFVGKTREQFVNDLLKNLPITPNYFRSCSQINRTGPATIGDNLPGEALSAEKVQALIAKEAIPLDTRDGGSFGEAHLPGAVSIPYRAGFSMWVGTVLKPEQNILFVLNRTQDYPALVWSLLRIGFDRVAGYLDGGMDAWRAKGLPIEVLPQITVNELQRRMDSAAEKPLVLDARTMAEWNSGHISGASHFPVTQINELENPAASGPIAIVCGSGYRSSIVCSLLARRGVRNLSNVVGGMNAWRGAGLPTVK